MARGDRERKTEIETGERRGDEPGQNNKHSGAEGPPAAERLKNQVQSLERQELRGPDQRVRSQAAGT